MHQGERLRWLINRSGKSRQDVALAAGISPASLYNYFKEETINSKKLKKLAKSIGVDESEFFDKNQFNEDPAKYIALQEKIRTLEEVLRDKETIIIQQQEIIDMLKGKNKKK